MSEFEVSPSNPGERASKTPKYASRHYAPKGKASLAAGLAHVARRSLEETWLGRQRGAPLVSDPHEVTRVAKVFDDMVRISSLATI